MDGMPNDSPTTTQRATNEDAGKQRSLGQRFQNPTQTLREKEAGHVRPSAALHAAQLITHLAMVLNSFVEISTWLSRRAESAFLLMPCPERS